MKMPKAIFVAAPADFTRFEECLKSLAEKYLSPTWEWTYKVNGKVQQEIEKKDPENEGVQIIKKTTQKEEKHDISSFRTPQRESGSGSVSASGRRIPPPPSAPPALVSRVVADVLGKRDWQIAKLRDGEEKFFKADTNTFEERELLGMRKEIWEWMVLSLEGEHKTLFCAHLVRECDKWDIQQLYKTVREFLHTENYREYGERMERFFTARPKEGEDIFSFMSRMDKYEEEIGHLQHLALEAGETLKMPKFCRVWKILSAVEKYPEYRVFTDKVQQMAPKEWIALSPETVRQELHKIHSNKVSLSSEKKDTQQQTFFTARAPPPPPPVQNQGARERDAGAWKTQRRPERARASSQQRTPTPTKQYTVGEKLQYHKCPEGECLGHFRSGVCPRKQLGKPCVFKHTQKNNTTPTSPHINPEHPGRSRSMSPVLSGEGVRAGQRGWERGGCTRCGGAHTTEKCTWDRECYECGGMHAARMCRKKKDRTTRTTQFGGGAPNRERRNSV